MDPEEITAHLRRRAQWSASRSSGPGGQHRDKAATRAELTIETDSLEGLDADVAAWLARALGLEAGPSRIAIQDERSLPRNQALAAQRLRGPRGRGTLAAATAALPAASGSKPRRAAGRSSACAGRRWTRATESGRADPPGFRRRRAR